jgi:glycosyltransferase involved in cell wall biosynthesis
LRILVLSFYYQPDLCAGSFRCTALVEQLLKKNANCIVDVISTLPNRYTSFSAEALRFEQNERLNIHRVALPTHKNGMLDQAKSFIKYYVEASKIANNNQYDMVFATSSRLFTAFLGKRIASKKKLPLYLDIRDIFIDTLENILPKKLSFILSPLLNIIENYTFSRTNKINLVSKGFLSYFNSKYPNVDYDFFTNGIDYEFINRIDKAIFDEKTTEQVKTILYAGNIGEGQGLHKIIPQLAKKIGDRFLIKIVGDGGKKQELVDAVKKFSLINVEFLPPVNRSELIEYYSEADILFLHLNDYDAFKKVLPSKIFEYATFNKPILAGVSGYAAKFITSNISNAFVFKPCDFIDAFNQISQLTYDSTDRSHFVKKFSRDNIMSEMSDSILSLVVDE